MVIRIWTVNANSHVRLSRRKMVPKGDAVDKTALLDTKQEMATMPVREKFLQGCTQLGQAYQVLW